MKLIEYTKSEKKDTTNCLTTQEVENNNIYIFYYIFTLMDGHLFYCNLAPKFRTIYILRQPVHCLSLF